MKSRWITLLGRAGSILLVVGLVLALVSIIPSAPLGFTLGPWGRTFRPGKYSTLYAGFYSPRTGLRISATSNNSLQLYLLATDPLQLGKRIRSWMTEHFPTLNERQVSEGMYNASVLEAFLQTHPEDALLNETLRGERSIDFFPSKVTNVTLVISNPSLMRIDANVKITGVTTLVSRERVATPTAVLIVSGMALALPWTVKKRKDYVRSS